MKKWKSEFIAKNYVNIEEKWLITSLKLSKQTTLKQNAIP